MVSSQTQIRRRGGTKKKSRQWWRGFACAWVNLRGGRPARGRHLAVTSGFVSFPAVGGMAHSGQRAANLAIEAARLAYIWPTFGVTWGNSTGYGASVSSGLRQAPFPADSLGLPPGVHLSALAPPQGPHFSAAPARKPF